MTTPLSSGKIRLVRVLRATKDVIRADDVMAALSLGRTETSKLLSRWASQGWIRRVGRGVYVPAQLDSLDSEHVLEDPWVLVPALFSPAYIGGWTAAEHWDLTEQVFRDIVVLTTRPARSSRQEYHGIRFSVHHVQEQKMFGTTPTWRGSSRVLVSDVHRTLVDILDTTSLGGGIQHVADCFASYLKRDDRNDALLLQYAKQLDNGAVFKRLGFLAEKHSNTAEIRACSKAHMSKGTAKLDASMDCRRLITRWRLWVPQSWVSGKPVD